jgi:hypothetical protein
MRLIDELRYPLLAKKAAALANSFEIERDESRV